MRGDIHDLGKSIVAMMLSSYGLVVHDLGVDVASAEVARRARELSPDVVGLSGLLTVATEGMRATIVELSPDVVGLSGLLTVATEGMRATIVELRKTSAELGRELPVIIGGGIVNEQTCAWTGADLWANDAAHGVQLIREAVSSVRSGRMPLTTVDARSTLPAISAESARSWKRPEEEAPDDLTSLPKPPA